MGLLEPALRKNAVIEYSRAMVAPAYGGGVFCYKPAITNRMQGDM